MLAAAGDGWAVDSKISVVCVAAYSCPCMMPSVHRLRLRYPALVPVEAAEVVDRVQRGRVVRPQRLFLPRQNSLIHRLRLLVSPMITVE